MIIFLPWYSRFQNCENLRPVIFFKDCLVFLNMACKHFLADFQRILREFKNVYIEEFDDLNEKSFTGRYSGLISC